ncbi:MAG: lycopene cyclase domain-containing protein [Flavobacteriaceae bacterium]
MNQYLYLILNLGSLSVPLLYSVFEKKFHFIQYFKAAFLSIVIVAIPFLIWDGIFTSNSIWGFNPEYYLGFKIFKMPIEEWLFFFCIPYACLFTHEVLKYYFPKFKLSKIATILLTIFLISASISIAIFNLEKWYTVINYTFFGLLMIYSLVKHIEILQEYYPSFFVILIPFLIINGVLTGSLINEPVVWYNNTENLNLRVLTIPVEDFFYAFTMLFSVQLIFNFLKNKFYETK